MWLNIVLWRRIDIVKIPCVLNLGSRRKAVVSFTISGCVFFQTGWEPDSVSSDFFLSIMIQKRITLAFFFHDEDLRIKSIHTHFENMTYDQTVGMVCKQKKNTHNYRIS